jgi:hypothetical protein
MAKKVVATLKSGKGKDFTKVIKMVKSPKTGAYTFKEEIVHNDHVADFLKTKIIKFLIRLNFKFFPL